MTMANIYEIKNEFNTLWSILEDELVDDDALVGAWETATEDLAEKLENCCKYIKNEEAVIAGLKEEEERLNARRKAKENAIKRLKQLMQDAMNAAGEKKLKLENEQLKQIKENPVLITEIVDNRVGADVDYSQNW